MPQALRVELRMSAALARNLRNHPYLLGSPLRDFLNRATQTVRSHAVDESPVDTGRLRASHHAEVQAGPLPMWGRVGPNVAYGVMVHEGTRPHVIRPSGKRALFWPGAAHPVRSVNHPGTKANPWLERALGKSRNEIAGFGRRLLADIKGRWGA